MLASVTPSDCLRQLTWLNPSYSLALPESLLQPCLTRQTCSGMALAEVLYKEQGEKANPTCDIDEKIMCSSCAKTHHVWHQDCVAGKPSRWFRSSAVGCCKSERAAKNDILGVHWDVELCSFQPQCKTEIPLGSSTTSPPSKVLPLSPRQVPAQCLSGLENLVYSLQIGGWLAISSLSPLSPPAVPCASFSTKFLVFWEVWQVCESYQNESGYRIHTLIH